MTTKILKHEHLVIKAKIGKPIKSTTEVEHWLSKLITSIGMETLLGPYSVYSEMDGNRGITAIAAITTSHIALHIWDEVEPAEMHLDVYSCSRLEPSEVIRSLDAFEVIEVSYKFFDRERGFIDIDR